MLPQYIIDVDLVAAEQSCAGSPGPIRAALASMAKDLAGRGWKAHESASEGAVKLRFWLPAERVEEEVSHQMARRLGGVRGWAMNIAKALGQEREALDLSKGMIRDKVEKELEKDIDELLLGLDGLDGVSVKKGQTYLLGGPSPEPSKNSRSAAL